MHPALEARLLRLAPDQRAAATTPPGPVLCVAPAGSGKTTTVVARLAWRVAGGADPAGICALTFNRAAALELQARADAALAELGYAAGSVRVRTFHALGREILVDAGVDVTHIVERRVVLDELAGSSLSAQAHRRLDDAFTRLKLDPERGPPADDEEIHRAFDRYQHHLREQGAIDLDDLVALAAPALRADPALLARWHERAAVLFVDEAQDLDRSQLDLALLLTGERRDVFLVGDDDQTIYAWRLADVRRVLGLASRLPGLRRVDLETNHRCAPEVVRRAARLVEQNQERFAKVIRASPRNRGYVSLLPDPGDEVARARYLLSAWLGAHPGEPHAILARTNRELVPYVAVALELGLPFRVSEAGLLLDDPDVARVLAVAATSGPEVPLLPRLAAAADAAGVGHSLASTVLGWAAAFDDLAGFVVALTRRREALAILADLPADGAGSPPRDRLVPAAPGAMPTSDGGAMPHGSREPPLLTLATAHGTKGLEWEHVACIGHDDGSFPSGRALREADDPRRVLEEERRLAYVAWTRARRSLTIVYDPGAPSRFVLEAFDHDELP
jgi:DNA helicase-2/ATP-dependent DNA helicase PcrA